MISLERLLSNTPLPITDNIYFYQGTLQDIADMGETIYLGMLKIWDISREELLTRETQMSLQVSDFDIWKAVICGNKDTFTTLVNSMDFFLHTKIEFLEISNTIMIGEGESYTLLTEDIYKVIKDISHSLFLLVFGNQEDEQYKESKNMSAKEKELIEKMRKREQTLNELKNQGKKTEDRLANQIISLVAIGHYTFDEVYKLTLLQMVTLLKKYVDIQQYELYIPLSPYMDSKTEKPKHWLEM